MEKTWTIESFLTSVIQHSETYPDVDELTPESAQTLLDALTDDLRPTATAQEVMDTWNRLVHDKTVMSLFD